RLGCTVVPVGAAFDLHSGVKPSAPRFMQRIGMEWLFRLASEPIRLWRRYLFGIPIFMYGVAADHWWRWRDAPEVAIPRQRSRSLFRRRVPDQAEP
ncbi:MAG TPA: WecB/TagA/CpsF family glycosyltransferase, partial [Micromonosporaceae bacterium]|nr:WecB/TagA/CpsF family glycosyltransferase [Micromonosporaceae bacterium]